MWQDEKLYLFSAYRNPKANDSIFYYFLGSLTDIQDDDSKAVFLFIGDFNDHHMKWLSSVSFTDYHGLRALDFSSEAGCEQLIDRPTHISGNRLDLIFSDTPGVVTYNVGTPIATLDYSYVSAVIKTENLC